MPALCLSRTEPFDVLSCIFFDGRVSSDAGFQRVDDHQSAASQFRQLLRRLYNFELHDMLYGFEQSRALYRRLYAVVHSQGPFFNEIVLPLVAYACNATLLYVRRELEGWRLMVLQYPKGATEHVDLTVANVSSVNNNEALLIYSESGDGFERLYSGVTAVGSPTGRFVLDDNRWLQLAVNKIGARQFWIPADFALAASAMSPVSDIATSTTVSYVIISVVPDIRCRSPIWRWMKIVCGWYVVLAMLLFSFLSADLQRYSCALQKVTGAPSAPLTVAINPRLGLIGAAKLTLRDQIQQLVAHHLPERSMKFDAAGKSSDFRSWFSSHQQSLTEEIYLLLRQEVGLRTKVMHLCLK
jgi:hypothetical protein